MKKFFLLVMGFLSLSCFSHAETVDSTRAVNVAKKWFQQIQTKKQAVSRLRVRTRVSDIKNVETQQYNNQETFYIVNMTGGGFVLVSAEDAIAPVLGYSEKTELDTDSINPATQAWLDYYSQQIAHAISLGITNTNAINDWEALEGNDMPTETAALSVPARPPLIATKWGQSAYYNTFTPDNTVTGCVATAMAQIMKFHNYPEIGSGQNSYTHTTYGILSQTFNTPYEWTKMPVSLSGSSSSEEITAVATLMYHCGISVNMDYSSSSSTASTSDTPESLINYFGYASTASYLSKSDYTDQQWTDLIIAELNANRPIIYRGSGPEGGHAFLCDGYQGAEYFHFNWGWKGSADGYFQLSLLDPLHNAVTYDFSSDQKAVFGIKPSKIYQRMSVLEEGFESSFPPTGWSQNIVVSGTPSPEWSQVSSGTNPTCTPSGFTYMLQFNSNSTTDGAEARIETPQIDLTDLDFPRLTFMMYHEDSNSSKTTEGISVQISEDGSVWTELQFYPRYTLSSGWQSYRVDLTYYTGKTIYLGFLGHSANGSNIYIDSIEITEAGPTSFMESETQVAYVGAEVSFTDTSFDASSYVWDFGDTSTATTMNATHVY